MVMVMVNGDYEGGMVVILMDGMVMKLMATVMVMEKLMLTVTGLHGETRGTAPTGGLAPKSGGICSKALVTIPI